MKPEIATLADEIWNQLAEASLVEHPMLINIIYDDVVTKEDSNNHKVCIVVFSRNPQKSLCKNSRWFSQKAIRIAISSILLPHNKHFFCGSFNSFVPLADSPRL
jgi:hypothetical protein